MAAVLDTPMIHSPDTAAAPAAIPAAIPAAQHARALLTALGVPDAAFAGGSLAARSPIDGTTTGAVHEASAAQVQQAVGDAHSAFQAWRLVPAPRRGELVRLFSDELRAHKSTQIGRAHV